MSSQNSSKVAVRLVELANILEQARTDKDLQECEYVICNLEEIDSKITRANNREFTRAKALLVSKK